MSSVIKSWFLPFLEKEFENAYERLHPTFRPGNAVEVDHYRCTSSSLSIHSTKSNRLQIISVSTTKRERGCHNKIILTRSSLTTSEKLHST